jgi:integrase
MQLTAAKRGRKSKPCQTSWGETIDGLYRTPGTNQYRIVATGRSYRENDERTAVARFREWQRSQQPRDVVVPTVPAEPKVVGDYEHGPLLTALTKFVGAIDAGTPVPTIRWEGPVGARDVTISSPPIDGTILWPWLRQMLLTHPEVIARHVSIPQLATLADWELPRDSIHLTSLMSAYEKHNKSLPLSKRKVRYAWDEFTATTGAKTLRDLTTDALLAYADKMNELGHGPNYVHDKYNRVKRVIAFGRKRGFNAAEIRAALDRAAVLVPPAKPPEADPQPVSREDFRMLLNHADDYDAAALLVSLNCCMYISEFLSVDWDEVNWETGTYLTRRNKTGITRAAVLWTRTLEALKKLERTPGAIFKSERGERYHPNSYRKVFDKLRVRAGVPHVSHNQLRDGAYTASCTHAVGLHLAQILAGHAQSGETDKYVRRNPEMVRPACEAVERAYFG